MVRRLASVSNALTKALAAADLEPRDSATAALAKRYAAELDARPDRLKEIGPLLLTSLAALGMTRQAAARIGRGEGPSARRQSFDELRARRGARKHAASAVDASSSAADA